MKIERKHLLETGPIIIMVIMFSVGMVSHNFDMTMPIMKALTGPFLLLMSAMVISTSYRGDRGKYLIWIGVAYLVTYLLEVLGAATGLVFGDYSYGVGLGLKLFGVPLIIGLNWVMVVLGAYLLVGLFTDNGPLRIAGTAFLAVLFDWIMEPVAMELDYWDWAGGTIPVQNYVAWFIIALGMAVSLYQIKPRVRSKVLSVYFLIQAVFFASLRLTLL